MRRILEVFSFILIAAIPAAAQDRPVTFNLGGGGTFPMGKVADSFDTGWTFQFGGEINITETFGFEADYGYHRLEGPERVFPGQLGGDAVLIESNQQMHVGSFNLIVRSKADAPVGGYVLGGPGVYHRVVQLTTPSVGIASVCDPYWYVCYPVAVPVDQIVGDRSATDFGFDVGGGLTLGRTAKFFVEMRYHYVLGSEITLPDGSTRSTTAQYFPLTFGVRF